MSEIGVKPDPSRDDRARDLVLGSTAERLAGELRRARRQVGDVPDGELINAVSSYTLAMKREGYAVERVVIALKQTMSELGFLDPLDGQSNLRQAVITICIEDFYRDGHPR
jgi:hypothetical protein